MEKKGAQLEEAHLRDSILVAEGAVDIDLKRKVAMDKYIIQLLQTACKNDKEARALDLSTSLQLCMCTLFHLFILSSDLFLETCHRQICRNRFQLGNTQQEA